MASYSGGSMSVAHSPFVSPPRGDCSGRCATIAHQRGRPASRSAIQRDLARVHRLNDLDPNERDMIKAMNLMTD